MRPAAGMIDDSRVIHRRIGMYARVREHTIDRTA